MNVYAGVCCLFRAYRMCVCVYTHFFSGVSEGREAPGEPWKEVNPESGETSGQHLSSV